MSKICVVCGVEFSARRKDARYCSNQCRCRGYYREHLDQERKRKILRYWTVKSTDYERLRAINIGASRRYKQRHREKVREYNKQYQCRTKQARIYHDKKYFDGKRQATLARYNNMCALCQEVNALVVHHVDGSGRLENINNTDNNLIVLCRKCHLKVHYRGQLKNEDIVRAHVKA